MIKLFSQRAFSRLPFISIPKYYFNQTIKEDEIIHDPRYETVLAAEHYKQGLEKLQEGKYRVALEFFNRFKGFLETSNLKDQKEWIDVSRRIIYSNLQIHQYEDAEKQLEEIIRQYQQQKANFALVYSAYNDLFAHCLKYNLNKAILLGKALLSDKEKQNIPLGYQKQFLYHLGTAYLLKENYADAKARLRECLQCDPSNQLKGWALNSLAVASWWHKSPLNDFMSDEEEQQSTQQQHKQPEPDYPVENIEDDFENVVSLLKKSIYYIEHGNNPVKPELQWLLNDDLLPNEHQAFLNKTQLTNKFNGKPLTNLSEFLYSKQMQKKTEIQFWVKYTIKFFEDHDPENLDRSLIFLAWMCSTSKHFERAEILYKIVLDMLKDKYTYNRVLCLQLCGSLLKKMPGRRKDAELVLIKAIKLAEELPIWSNRLVHVIVPDFEI